MPFSSRACQTCKIRRVKIQCDETKPTCLRCSGSGKICIFASVVEQPGFVFNLENAYASGKVKRPRGPRSCLTSLRPRFDLEARAVAYYLQDHLVVSDDVPDVVQSLCTYVGVWKGSGVESTMVDLALSAASLAVFSRVKQHPQAGAEAAAKYSVLLQLLKERITDMELASWDNSHEIDACLLTMFLMGRYEAAMPPTSSTVSESLQRYFHHEGGLAVLKAWVQRPNPPRVTPIVKLGRRGLIRSSLLRTIPLPDWILEGERFGEQDREMVFDRVLVGAVNLHHETGFLLRRNDGLSPSAVLALLGQARGYDESLRDWAKSLPPTWSYQRHTLTDPGPWPKRHFYSPTAYSFQTVGQASVWSQYFATRMLINSTRLKLLDIARRPSYLGSQYGQSEWLESSILLNSMADRLAFTIPFALGRLEMSQTSDGETLVTVNLDKDMKPSLAALIVWQLTLAASMERVDPKQQRWFRSETAQLGRRIGNHVLESAEADGWLVL
ncbi:hypothetical protein FOPE_00246 [Fonsecaea pedrosoi]|nr:hypothetical protein FOPE_00246 [Fonsecaea pedrosoi]